MLKKHKEKMGVVNPEDDNVAYELHIS